VYSTCLYCHASLGENEAVEAMPVGRRLAFDEEKGRLWAVCTRCLRWNLTPFDERFDAIEACERLFRGTRLRMSTDNVGLARLRDGTELVRVGPALRPELAAWRFGAQLARRRRNYGLFVAGGVVATVAVTVGIKLAGGALVGGNWAWQLMNKAWERVTAVRLPDPLGAAPFVMMTPQARAARIRVARDSGETVLEVSAKRGGRVARYEGARLRDVAPKVFARLNRTGSSRANERRAVELLERVAEERPGDLFAGVLRRVSPAGYSEPLNKYAAGTALALEMALQEDRERVAMAGELLELEAAWREAEELANIADSLVPSSVDRALANLKERLGR